MKIAFCRLIKAAASVSLFVASIVGAGWSAGMAQTSADPSPNEAAYLDMRTFMVKVINPAANAIWNGGYADKLSKQDWERIKEAATQLSETAPTVSLGGPALDERERSRMPVWKTWSQRYSDAVLRAKGASESGNQSGLATAGDALVDVCEGCHMAVAAAAP